MIQKAIAFGIAVIISGSLMAQETKKVRRPDLPGSFIIEFGFNTAQGTTPANFDQGVWGSRTLNLYYQYPIRLWQTKFSFNPGLGLSFERYKFSNNFTLPSTPNASGQFDLVRITDVYTNASPVKSMLIMNYLEFMPVELRFDTKPEDLARSIHVSAGLRVGLLYDSHTKVVFDQGGEEKTIKDKQKFGLNSFRYGLYGRVGIGNFNLFYNYTITPVFDTAKAPSNSQMNTATIGISLSGF
jgi:hypothetical protein